MTVRNRKMEFVMRLYPLGNQNYTYKFSPLGLLKPRLNKKGDKDLLM